MLAFAGMHTYSRMCLHVRACAHIDRIFIFILILPIYTILWDFGVSNTMLDDVHRRVWSVKVFTVFMHSCVKSNYFNQNIWLFSTRALTATRAFTQYAKAIKVAVKR